MGSYQLYRLIYQQLGVLWIGCILAVSMYMCKLRLMELTVAWQNVCVSPKSNYTAVLYEPVSKLYI